MKGQRTQTRKHQQHHPQPSLSLSSTNGRREERAETDVGPFGAHFFSHCYCGSIYAHVQAQAQAHAPTPSSPNAWHFWTSFFLLLSLLVFFCLFVDSFVPSFVEGKGDDHSYTHTHTNEKVGLVLCSTNECPLPLNRQRGARTEKKREEKAKVPKRGQNSHNIPHPHCHLQLPSSLFASPLIFFWDLNTKRITYTRTQTQRLFFFVPTPFFSFFMGGMSWLGYCCVATP